MTEWLRFIHLDVTRYHVTHRGKWLSSLVLFAIEIVTVLALVFVGGAPWWLAIACEMALSLGGRAHGIVTVNEQLTEHEAILDILRSEPRLHGLQIGWRLSELRGHEVGPGSYYQTLHRLERRGLISSEWDGPASSGVDGGTKDGPRRRIYQLVGPKVASSIDDTSPKGDKRSWYVTPDGRSGVIVDETDPHGWYVNAGYRMPEVLKVVKADAPVAEAVAEVKAERASVTRSRFNDGGAAVEFDGFSDDEPAPAHEHLWTVCRVCGEARA